MKEKGQRREVLLDKVDLRGFGCGCWWHLCACGPLSSVVQSWKFKVPFIHPQGNGNYYSVSKTSQYKPYMWWKQGVTITYGANSTKDKLPSDNTQEEEEGFFLNLLRSLFSKSQHLDLCCHSWTAIFVTEEWSNVYIISYFLSFLSKLMVSCCTEQDEEKYRKFMIDCLLVSPGTRGRGNNLIILFGEFQWNSSMVLRSSFVTV